MAHGGAVGVVLVLGAGQRSDRLLHQRLHHLQPGAYGQRQQAFLGRLSDLSQRDVTSAGMVSSGVLAVALLVWYCLATAVPFLVVLLADHPRPTRRQGSGGDRHLNFYESRDNLTISTP
jgi:hypothetical protein